MSICINVNELLSEAAKAQSKAHAPYSGIRVGCAILDRDGLMFLGANIENASFGLSLCAERVAVANAVMNGSTIWTALAVVSDSDQIIVPCGACLQVLSEFSDGELKIIWASKDGLPQVMTISELLLRPCRFQ
jgi:cytidine deaminase